MIESVEKLTDNFYFLPNAQAMVELTGERHDVLGGQQYYAYNAELGIPGSHVPWGGDNLAPQQMLKLYAQNPIKAQMVVTCRDLTLGHKLKIQERKLIDKKYEFHDIENPEIEDFLDALEINKFFRKAAYDLEFSGNYFASISIDKNRKVSGLDYFDSTVARCQKVNPKNGKIEAYHLHGDWNYYKPDDTKIVAAYDRFNPTSNREFIYHGRDWTPGQPYYDWAPWWGTKAWTEVANAIPEFHKKGLKNGYNIKYHIKVPAKYFEKFGDADKQKTAELEFNTRLNRFLSSQDSIDKAFVSKFGTDQETGKALPGFEIIALPSNMSDDAYTKLSDAANGMQAAGHGLLPQLAGISLGGKFGASGSELRSALDLYLATHAPNKRKMLLETLYIIKKIQGWDRSIFFNFEDLAVNNLDGNSANEKNKPAPSGLTPQENNQ